LVIIIDTTQAGAPVVQGNTAQYNAVFLLRRVLLLLLVDCSYNGPGSTELRSNLTFLGVGTSQKRGMREKERRRKGAFGAFS